MTGREGAHLLEEAIHFVKWDERYPGCPVEFVPGMEAGSGEFYDASSPGQPNGKVCIGFQDFQENWEKQIPLNVAVRSIAAFYHEACGHGMQAFELFNTETPLARTLAVYELAGRGSRSFYGVEEKEGSYELTDQYFNNPVEIAADYAGWYMTDRFLTEKFDAKTSNRLCCDGVNSIGWAYGSKRVHYRDIGQFFDNMEKDFRKAVLEHKQYEPDAGGMDDVSRYAEMHNRPDLPGKVRKMKNGLQQAWAIAACRNEANGRIYAGKDVFRHLEMDPAKIADYKKNNLFVTKKDTKTALGFVPISRMLDEAAADLRDAPDYENGMSYY